MEEEIIGQEKNEEVGNETDPEKAEDEEYRNFKEEPGDDDGENRKPTKKHSIFLTSMFVTKFMIGSSILSIPQIFKTFGIIKGLVLTLVFNCTELISAYLLLKCKDITQRYSYAIYSKITMGLIGRILTKLSLILMKVSTNCVHFIVFSTLLRNILLTIFGEKRDVFYFNSKFILIIFAMILMPLIFHKDISGLSRFTYLGVIALGILFISTVILFFYKYANNEITEFKQEMLYSNGTYAEMFKCFGGYHNAFVFQAQIFAIYLPLYPRNTKNMMKSCLIGSITSSTIYALFGLVGFIMYKDHINDSLIKNFGEELTRFVKSNYIMAGVLVICQLAFIINSAFSSILGFFIAKKNLFGLIKFILKKFDKEKKLEKNDGEDGTQLSDLDEKGIVIEKEKNYEEKEYISQTGEFWITLLLYIFITTVALTTDKIIGFASFSGATVSNFICVLSPGIFYLYFSRKKPFHVTKFLAIINLFLGSFLILGFFGFNFQKIIR
jgi:amino acid permease